MAKEESQEKPVQVEKKRQVEVTQIVTQTSDGYVLPDGTVVNPTELLAWMANQIYELNKKI